MNIKLKIIIILFSLFIICIVIALLFRWRNPDMNPNNIACLQKCVYQNPKTKKIKLDSMSYTTEVTFIENSGIKCFNPFFPIIHIRINTNGQHNAWVHIVRTDSLDERLKIFVDTAKEFKPFYNFEEDFYDAPHWRYGVFDKPLSFWEGHAYAVKVDHVTKTITCLGGIRWGFKLARFGLKPTMIPPSSLSLDDWELDWSFFGKSLERGYTLKTY